MSDLGHNGGPPLEDEHVPEWENGDPFVFFAWKAAHRRVWRDVPWETMLRRQARAEAVGLTYEEYALEILERGRHLGPSDDAAVRAIKAARPKPTLVPPVEEPGMGTPLRPVRRDIARRPVRGRR